MQTFAVTALDKPGQLELRMATRPAHLEYWQANDAALVLAGPFQDEEGKPCGSLLVVQAASVTAAEALVAADPYAEAGLFGSVEIRPWNWVLKRPAEA